MPRFSLRQWALIGLLILSAAFVGFLIYVIFFQAVPPSVTTQIPITQAPAQAPGGLLGLPSAPVGAPTALPGAPEAPLTPEKVRRLQETSAKASEIARGGVTKIASTTAAKTLSPKISNGGRTIQYYNANDSTFYSMDQNGKTVKLSEKTFFGVDSVTWSPDGGKSILEFPDGANILYDFATQEQVTLPKHWQEFSFSAQGDRIVFKSIPIDEEDNWLAVSNIDGSKTKLIENLGGDPGKVNVDWSPNNLMIATYTESLDFDRSELFFLGLNQENFRLTVVEGHGFEGSWSPDGDKILYSVYSARDDFKPHLWMVDALPDRIGNNRRDLNLATWSDKCTFAGDTTLYCAAPLELTEGAGLDRSLASETPDLIYKLDVATGTRQLLAVPDTEITVQSLMINEDESILYLVDAKDQSLKQVNLK
ncbi:MAG: hypothetical protein HY453_00445 [Parcubacteria group bacterium]|nr:hypothetical protein [Parcubacteria group bacterium]